MYLSIKLTVKFMYVQNLVEIDKSQEQVAVELQELLIWVMIFN